MPLTVMNKKCVGEEELSCSTCILFLSFFKVACYALSIKTVD